MVEKKKPSLRVLVINSCSSTTSAIIELLRLMLTHKKLYATASVKKYIGKSKGSPFSGNMFNSLKVKGREKNIPKMYVLMITAFFLSRLRPIIGPTIKDKTPPNAAAIGSAPNSFSDNSKKKVEK